MPLRRPAKVPQCRREVSLGPLRRAHPASGATFNVQVVKGKMSEKCLVHACRALTIGLLLMFIGGGMATIGYYTNTFAHDLRVNGTLPTFRYKSDNRGLHLNNLSYLGPIVMGVGGFIVVAACVITFEMRDSAAKVMPAKFKTSCGSSSGSSKNGHRGSSSRIKPQLSKTQWEQQLGVFRTSQGDGSCTDRRATTAALVHFSRTFGSPVPASSRRLSRCDSVPNIGDSDSQPPLTEVHATKPHRTRRHPRGSASLVQRSTRGSGSLLQPTMLQFHKAAISFDESRHVEQRRRDIVSSPQGSVKFDLTPRVMNDEPYRTPRMKPKRSDTARRHVLARQKQIFDENERRRNSKKRNRPARQCSYDSRMVTVSCEASPEATSKSQISICSEPPPTLSNRSSIDQPIPESAVREEDANDEECQLKRSSSTKSYKEKRKCEARKDNEIARVFAMQALKRTENQNQHDIDVISERRTFSSFASTMDDSVVVDIPFDTTTTSTEMLPPTHGTHSVLIEEDDVDNDDEKT